jgi:hypothetical protein
VLEFRQALLGVGAFLIILGVASAFLTGPAAAAPSGDLVELLSSGVYSAFMALFSGVPIGVGAALVANGLSFRLRGNHSHIALSFIFSALSVAVAMVSVADLKNSSYSLLVLFFAGMFAAAAFLFSAVAFALSGALSTYVASHSAPVPQARKTNKG